MKYIPQDIIDFDQTFTDDDIFQDSETAAKIILSVHYNYCVKPGLEEELDVIDNILYKISRFVRPDGQIWSPGWTQERQMMCERVKSMVYQGKIQLVDAIQALFSLEELECYGY